MGDAAFPVKMSVGGQVGAQCVFYIDRRYMTWLFHPPRESKTATDVRKLGKTIAIFCNKEYVTKTKLT